jgi:hypothetical protein
LKDAEKWTQFHRILQDQIDVAGKFHTKYSDLDYENEADDKALVDLEKITNNFVEKVSNRITQLDGVYQSLIQIVSILTIPTYHTNLVCAVQRNHLRQR